MVAKVEPVSSTGLGHAQLLERILQQTVPEVLNFVQRADDERSSHQNDQQLDIDPGTSSLMNPDSDSPRNLEKLLERMLKFENSASGPEGLQEVTKALLKYSVNPSSPGFLDKLYAAPLPPGIVAELVLGVLNTNLHVYHVSPVLTLVEKYVTRELARLFGLAGPRSGGISVQGGSASNLTSIVIARNSLFPETKARGNGAVDGQLVLFTSAHAHYSIEKAAQALGLGSDSVVKVPVDMHGRMSVSELRRLVLESKEQGDRPFYINATAGSTVLGSFDPFEEISHVAKEHGMWLHVDAAWGGGFVFSRKSEIRRGLRGIELADSIATNPHKMLGVPITCSFLLGQDLQKFQEANTLKAGYLFHDEAGDETTQIKDLSGGEQHTNGSINAADEWKEPYDLADLTLQCGRRGDSLKFFLSWKFYGTMGYADMVDKAHDVACSMHKLVQARSNLTPVLAGNENPSCLQVCFYYTPLGRFVYGLLEEPGHFEVPKGGPPVTSGDANMPSRKARLGKCNSQVTAKIAKALVSRGFMIDFAPALEGQEDKGSFFRVVVNISTVRETVERLIGEILQVGDSIVTSVGSGGDLTSFK